MQSTHTLATVKSKDENINSPSPSKKNTIIHGSTVRRRQHTIDNTNYEQFNIHNTDGMTQEEKYILSKAVEEQKAAKKKKGFLAITDNKIGPGHY